MSAAKVNWLDRRVAHPGPHLALCLSEAEYVKAMKVLGQSAAPPWIKTPQAHATAHYMTNQDSSLAVAVCLSGFEGRDPIEVAGILVHEATHAWQAYAEHIGETDPGKEQEAYAIQSISQALMGEFAARFARAACAPQPTDCAAPAAQS